MKSVVIFYNAEKPAARREVPRLKAWFRRRGLRVLAPDQAARAEAAVALGGDGTLLAAARTLAPLGVPVLGINLGRLGFLAATDLKNLYKTLDSLLKGKMGRSDRMMLQVAPARGRAHLALNDCVIRGRDIARSISLSAWINGKYLATYLGDGLILSTPTGSTAYSLAASGPIADPEMDLILLTPICSHSLTQRPLILPPESELEIRVEERGRGGVVMSLDGQINIPLRAGDRVGLTRSPERFHLYNDPGQNYFSILRHKLKWGER